MTASADPQARSFAKAATNPEIYERMHPETEAARAPCNAALKGSGIKISISEGARKEHVVVASRAEKRDVPAGTSSFCKQSSADLETQPSGAKVPRDDLLEWEAPFDWQGKATGHRPCARRSTFEPSQVHDLLQRAG